jgi:hypothetical protein
VWAPKNSTSPRIITGSPMMFASAFGRPIR